MSERRACRLVELDRGSYRYELRSDHNAQPREELVKLARQKPRFGYRRLHVLLSKGGYPASDAAALPTVSGERLMVRRLRRKRLVRPANKGRLLLPSSPVTFLVRVLSSMRRAPSCAGRFESRLSNVCLFLTPYQYSYSSKIWGSCYWISQFEWSDLS